MVILGVFVVAFVATIALSYNAYRENSRYKTYLSDVLSGKVSSMISTVSNLERTLNEVITSQTISRNQAVSLSGNFNGIKARTEEILAIGVRINRIERNSSDKLITTNTKLSAYYKNLCDALESEEVDQLSEAQLTGYTEFLELVSSYKSIANTFVLGVTDTGVSGEYWASYFAEGVEEAYWTDLINEMEAASPEYKEFTLLNRSTDIMGNK
jgi:hypothetical protein